MKVRQIVLTSGVVLALGFAFPLSSRAQATAGSVPNPPTTPPTGDRAPGGTGSGTTDKHGQTPRPAGTTGKEKEAPPTGKITTSPPNGPTDAPKSTKKHRSRSKTRQPKPTEEATPKS